MTAELLNVPMADYVADRFDGPPSLSSGLAHVMLMRSALHCWHEHPRLNPDWQPDEDRGFDLGTAFHAAFLEGREITALPFGDFRPNAAKAARDIIKKAGGLPLLEDDATAVKEMVITARAAIRLCPDLADIGEFLPERTIRWQETSDAWLRCRPDFQTYDHAVVISVKTTRASAEPDSFLRTILNGGYDLQAAFEVNGVKALTGKEPKYVWLAIECEPPYAVSLAGLSPALADLAQQKFRAAVAAWSVCMADNVWPGYPDRIAWLEPPAWASARWLEQAPAVDDGRPLADQLLGGQE